MPPSQQLVRARERLGFSQQDAGAAIGVSRAMVGYWESGARQPNDRQLVALSRLYRTPVPTLVGDGEIEPEVDLAAMLLRSEADLPQSAAPGLQDFVDFLDAYAKLAAACHEPIPGLTTSPFINRPGYDTKDDARRKAEEVRAMLGLGLGPISDIDWVCELLGITVYRSGLGTDLATTVSGAFLRHPDVGFSLLVNLDMTPGRRRFTVAHELAHALFHSEGPGYVLSGPKKDPRERFADAFAGEFLMPSEGVRRFMEENGLPRTLDDPADVIHIQRYFRVSYPAALVRLRRVGVVTPSGYDAMKGVRPLLLARKLGYAIEDEELAQDRELWRVTRFPKRFLRLLRLAVRREVISVPTAASVTGLTYDDIASLVTDPTDGTEALRTEFQEFEDSGLERTA